MNTDIRQSIRIGLVHFMAYPASMSGEGDILTSVKRVMDDPYFDAVEVTHIADPAQRAAVGKLAKQAGIALGYGAQPQLLRNRENLNCLAEDERQAALRRMYACIDEAYEIGASGIGYLSGRFEPGREEDAYQQLVKSTRAICGYAREKGGLQVNLEVFDCDVEKCALIGPAPRAARFAAEIFGEFDNFGLMIDLSHITQLRESLDENIDPIAAYIRHVHIANSVLTRGAPAYGDQHPGFYFPNSVVDRELLAAFLRKLIRIGYIAPGKRPIVAFEVKPWGDEDSETVLAGAKRFLREAWALV